MVDKRYTASDELNSYYFVQPPAERSRTNPRGFRIDGMMMPKRDIDDDATGGDSWKTLRGEDVAWAYEASLERRYAAHQFDGLFVNRQQHADEPYPTSRPVYRINDGTLRGWDWQYLIGDVEGSSQGGLAEVWNNLFLDVSAASDLKDYVYEWPDGSEIGETVQTGPDQWDFSRNRPAWALGGFAPYMGPKTAMKSSAADFGRGMPLSAESVRNVYRDVRKLNFYVCRCPTLDYSQDTTNGYNQLVDCSSWRLTSHEEQGVVPLPQPAFGKLVLYESSSWFDTDPVQWRWGRYEIGSGTYRIPYCGKYGRGQGYFSPLYGSEAAVYGVFELRWRNSGTSWENRSRVAFAKLDYVRRTDVGADDVSWSEVLSKAKAIRDRYQATISPPSGIGETPYCEVELADMFLVCRLSQRTDVSSLEWRQGRQ